MKNIQIRLSIVLLISTLLNAPTFGATEKLMVKNRGQGEKTWVKMPNEHELVHRIRRCTEHNGLLEEQGNTLATKLANQTLTPSSIALEVRTAFTARIKGSLNARTIQTAILLEQPCVIRSLVAHSPGAVKKLEDTGVLIRD